MFLMLKIGRMPLQGGLTVEEYLILIFRTLFLYALISLIYRIMGKREIGELGVLDIVVSIMIAELAVVALENPKEELFKHVLPMLVLMIAQIFFAYVSLKSKKFRDLVDGQPTIIINKGKIDERAMRKVRYNFDDLLLQLREKDISKISEVEFAILEASGNLSVFNKQDTKGGLTIPLVIDGRIQQDNLPRIEKTYEWLVKELKAKGYETPEDISFCSYENGQLFIDKQD